MIYYIYALCEPSGKERYIGMAKDIKDRMKAHIASAKTGNLPVNKWIRSLLDKCKKPCVSILYKCEGREMAASLEKMEIGRRRKALLNITFYGKKIRDYPRRIPCSKSIHRRILKTALDEGRKVLRECRNTIEQIRELYPKKEKA